MVVQVRSEPRSRTRPWLLDPVFGSWRSSPSAGATPVLRPKNGDPTRQAQGSVHDVADMPAELAQAARLKSRGRRPLAVVAAIGDHRSPSPEAAGDEARPRGFEPLTFGSVDR
jgi:hypothetical protein